MTWYAVLFPAGMILAPLVFLLLWCSWTGVRGLLKLALATLGVLLAFGLTSLAVGPEVASHTGFSQAWAMLGFFGLFFPIAMPVVWKAFRSLPEPPRGASLQPRRLELFRGALVWPFLAWAVLTAWVIARGELDMMAVLGPVCGLMGLVLTVAILPMMVHEPEPLGGPDPEALARNYARFRRQRVLGMYWLMVTLNLGITGLWIPLVGIHPGLLGGLAGCSIGLMGAVFGTWADARRYLLRRQAAGLEPPA